MSYLATLAQAKADSKVTNTDADSYLTQTLVFVSNRIETIKAMYFEPRRESLYFDACIDPVSPDGLTLYLSRGLVELYAVTLGDTTEMDLADIRLNPRGATPVKSLIITNHTDSFLDYRDIPEQSIEIEAAWCYRTEYSREAWVNTSTISGSINASVTTITPASVALFSVGHLARIGTEYLRVTAVGATTLTVERGVNGTTAASHSNAAVIAIFVPEPMVTRAALRWAAFLLSRRAAYEVVTFNGESTVTFPPDAPTEVTNILKDISRSRVMFGG